MTIIPLTFTLSVNLQWTTKAFPAISRIPKALDRFLKGNTHWLGEEEPQIVAVLQSDSEILIKYTSGLSLIKMQRLVV